MTSKSFLCSCAFGLGLAACGHGAPPPVTPAASAATPPPTAAVSAPSWEAFVAQSIEKFFVTHPPFAVAMGRHEFDGQLPDWSSAGLQREVAELEQMRAQAAKFPDEQLSPEQRFQRAYFLNRMDNELFWVRDARQPFVNPAYYFDGGLDPNTYLSMPYAPLETRLAAFIKYARALPSALAQIRANLQTPLPRSYVEYAVLGFDGFAEFFRKEVPAAFAEVHDEAKQKELSEVLTTAAQGMSDLARWLEGQRATATEAFALGEARFAEMLAQTEGVHTPLPELSQIARADLERNTKALNEACAQFAPKQPLATCVARVNSDKPKGGAVEGARAQLAELRSYIVEHHIVSIPGTEQAHVAEAPPYKRQNFAYIDIPGPYEKELPSVYYIAPPDPKWSKAERDAYVPGQADLLFTSVHEVWPGHFLQFLHSNRASWRFGQLFVGYAFAEGWAHYAEELMVEQGIAQGKPELWVGQILNALLRDVRFVCAIGLHTQGMSVAQCEQLFKDKAYQDPGNARQQAARGTYDPGYLNYTLGKLMLRKLRADWQQEHPGAPILEFHDAVLGAGGPPIPLLRTRLLQHDDGQLF
jgi:hypothetical protein